MCRMGVPDPSGLFGQVPKSVGPVDRRLWALGAESRAALALAIGAGGLGAALVVVQSWLIAGIVAGAFLNALTLTAAVVPVLLLCGVGLGRGLLAWTAPVLGYLAATRVRSRLRARLTEHLLRLPPSMLAGEPTGALAQAATAGVDALDGYFARYLPQLGLAVVVPVVAVVAILKVDLLSGVIVIVCLPLLPFFLYLVGAAAGARARRRQRVLDDLGGHFLDVLRGLPTLRCFNRGEAQADQVAGIAEQYRRTSMSTLRLAFLSSLVLELAAMLSTALVAVEIGLRVDAALLPLRDAFFVLMLVPEVFLPLRQAGLQFHAAADARAATDRVFSLLELEARPPGVVLVPPGAPPVLRLEEVTVRHPDRSSPALDRASLEVRAGERVALYGPSGGGKTTVLQVLLGLEPPSAGRVVVAGVDLRGADLDSWRNLVAWLPQEARLAHGTVAENVRWGDPSAADEAVAVALRDAGLPPESLPLGLATHVGEGGRELSAGQRRRVALARALVRRAPVLLLDEPGANLDVELQEQVGALLDGLPRDTTVVYCVHQPGLLERADRVVRVEAGTLR